MLNLSFYIETSSLRKLSNKLANEKIIQSSHTSILALVEILASVSNENFYKVKTLFENIKKFKLRIDIRFPEKIIAESFDLEFKEERLDSAFALLDLIIESISYSDFLDKEINANLEFDLLFFQNLDKNWGEIKPTTERENIAIIEEGYTKRNEADLQIFEKTELELSFKNFFELWNTDKYKALNYSSTLLALCINIAKSMNDKSDSTLESLYSSYNNDIDHFLILFSYYDILKKSKKEFYKRNDTIDLYHLLYMPPQNSNIKMVSSDKLLHLYNNITALSVIDFDSYLRMCSNKTMQNDIV